MSQAAHQIVVYVARAKRVMRLAGSGDIELTRRRVRTGDHDGELDLTAATAAIERITEVGVDDMPPQLDLILMLLEIAAQRHGDADRDAVWHSIGITSKRGAHLLKAPGYNTFDWPTWFTLRELALGDYQ